MSSRQIIDQATVVLQTCGFLQNQDYVFSLQGPTLILSKSGNKKMTPKLRGDLSGLGLEIL